MNVSRTKITHRGQKKNHHRPDYIRSSYQIISQHLWKLTTKHSTLDQFTFKQHCNPSQNNSQKSNHYSKYYRVVHYFYLKHIHFFVFVFLAGFDFTVAFFLGLAFAWAFSLLVALALAFAFGSGSLAPVSRASSFVL